MAAERDRADVREARESWMGARQARMRDQPAASCRWAKTFDVPAVSH